jgi:Fic family protein
MKSLAPGFIESLKITPRFLQTIRLLGEYKGKEALFKQQTPQALETLRQVAVIQSMESSNRIEGITAPLERIQQLVKQESTPRDRSEQEIAGYRDVLNTIHANHESIPFTPNIVLQLHRDLYQFKSQPGGVWKPTDNDIVETLSDGTRHVRFRPLPAHLTPDAMTTLHLRFNEMWDKGDVDPLMLISMYVLDFLCIHPFPDGNGRMARLLTLLLLYRAGYEVGRYISLEKMIEVQKEGYYDTLARSSNGWHDGQHDPMMWTEFFLGVMLLGAYREFEARMQLIDTGKGAKTALVLDVVTHFAGEFTVGDLREKCPNVGVDLLRRILRRERDAGNLECLGRGPDARWKRK